MRTNISYMCNTWPRSSLVSVTSIFHSINRDVFNNRYTIHFIGCNVINFPVLTKRSRTSGLPYRVTFWWDCITFWWEWATFYLVELGTLMVELGPLLMELSGLLGSVVQKLISANSGLNF